MEELIKIIADRINEEGYECYLNNIDTSKITNLNEFAYEMKKKGIDIMEFNCDASGWNISNMTSLCGTFSGCAKFNKSLDKWNVSNLKMTGYMFDECEKFNQPLNRWDVSNIEDAEGMFAGTSSFNQDLSDWNFSPKEYEIFLMDQESKRNSNYICFKNKRNLN